MQKNRDGLNRSFLWTAWDANTKCFRRTPGFRRVLRRTIKRQQRFAARMDIREQLDEFQNGGVG